MKKHHTLFVWGICSLLILAVSSCATRKDLAYLQNLEPGSAQQYATIEQKIEVGDMLGIMVNSKNPELARPFNLPMVGYYSPEAGEVSSAAVRLQGYTVEADGSIVFPVLGRIPAAGHTRLSLAQSIEKMLSESNLLKDAKVTTTLLNFRVLVLGDVLRPGSYDVHTDRITLFEAIARAGDVNLTARRDNVLVIREDEGKRISYQLDLRDTKIFESPAFYLKQNDVIIVEPNKYKVQTAAFNSSNNLGSWLSLVSTATSLTTFYFTIQKLTAK